MKRIGWAVLPWLGCLAAGCGPEGGADGGSSPVAVTFVGLEVVPSPGRVSVGESAEFAAVAAYSDGSQALLPVLWEVADPGIAMIQVGSGGESARVTGVSEGQTVVTVRLPSNPAVLATSLLTVSTTPPDDPVIDPASPPDGLVTQFYSWRFTATGGSGVPAWLVTQGAIPSGLSLDGLTGVLSGVPSQDGTYSFTLQVTAGGVDTETFSIVIHPSVIGPPPRKGPFPDNE